MGAQYPLKKIRTRCAGQINIDRQVLKIVWSGLPTLSRNLSSCAYQHRLLQSDSQTKHASCRRGGSCIEVNAARNVPSRWVCLCPSLLRELSGLRFSDSCQEGKRWLDRRKLNEGSTITTTAGKAWFDFRCIFKREPSKFCISTPPMSGTQHHFRSFSVA